MKTPMTLPERIRAYLDKIPGAVSGQGGHSQTFAVACALVNGFGLAEYDALAYLQEYNLRCDPPWKPAELEHKIKSAAEAKHDKPRFHLVGKEPLPKSAHPKPQTEKPAPALPVPHYEVSKAAEIPPPMDDAARRFLVAAFLPGEGIGAVGVVLNEEGKAIPDGKELSFTREEWLRKLDEAQGNPNKLFPARSKSSGAFVRVNPMKLGGNADADVTAFRHTLLEFDNISIPEQWNLYKQSEIPCTAVILSGAKSVHAWVRVDAKDRKDYNYRVGILYDHFSHYGIDVKNKNPSRYSRLPGMKRGEKTQDLLALNIGAKSFDQWIIDRAADGIGQQISVKELLAFDVDNDQNSILGRRWLCRSGSCLWIGSSGIGKSSLAMQAALTWGMGKSLFGMCGPKPLKSMFIQAENDFGDMAEMMQGVLNGMDISDTKVISEAINKRLVIIRECSRTGKAFTDALLRLIEKHRPDLVWIDPVLSFIGEDISSQKVCSEFFRNWLNPIAEATGVCFQILHHTGKPSTDPKAKRGWTNSDYSYAGIGSSEMVNWARATAILSGHGEDLFRLRLGKRGNRAGAKNLAGDFTKEVYLRHSEKGICWVQTEEPEPVESVNVGPGRKKKSFNYEGFAARHYGEPMLIKSLVANAARYANVSERWIYENALFRLKELMKFNSIDDTFCFPAASGNGTATIGESNLQFRA